MGLSLAGLTGSLGKLVSKEVLMKAGYLGVGAGGALFVYDQAIKRLPSMLTDAPWKRAGLAVAGALASYQFLGSKDRFKMLGFGATAAFAAIGLFELVRMVDPSFQVSAFGPALSGFNGYTLDMPETETGGPERNLAGAPMALERRLAAGGAFAGLGSAEARLMSVIS